MQRDQVTSQCFYAATKSSLWSVPSWSAAGHSSCLSQTGVCLTCSSFSRTTQTFGERDEEALGFLSPLAFTFPFKASCLQVSLLHQPLHADSRNKLYCLPLDVFRLILGFHPLVQPFPEENQSVHHLKLFPNSSYPTVKFSMLVCLLTIQINR